MTASYPSSVRSYKAVVDLVDTVIADNVNSLQEEIKALETVLGSATTNQNPLASTWSGSFSTATTWGTVYDRLANIEAGLVSGVTNAPYVLTSGGSSITTTNNKGLQLKAGSSSLNLLEAYSYGNTLNFTLDASGLPKVGANNIIYVGSSDYVTLTTATASANTNANGRIPLSTVTAAGDLIVGSGSATVVNLAKGSSGQALIMNGTSVAWGTPTDTTKIPLSTVTTAGDLIVGSGSGAVSRLGIGTSGYYLTSNGSTPAWTALPAVVSQTNGTVTTAAIASGVVRNTFVKTTTPTGTDGNIGDIWIVYA